MAHIPLNLAFFALILVSLAGVGRLAWRLLGLGSGAVDQDFWLGFALCLGFLLVWHFRAPVGPWVWLPLGAASLAGLGLGARDWRAAGGWKPSPRFWLWAALVAVAAVVLAQRAGFPNCSTDVGAYHLPTMRWIEDYRLVPGLANLHVRFAYNSSYFLILSAYDFQAPWPHPGAFFSCALVLVLCGRCLWAASGLLTGARATPSRVYHTLALAALPVLFTSPELASPSNDPPIFVLGLVLGGYWTRLWLDPPADGARRIRLVIALGVLAAAGTTVKLGFTVLGALAGLLALGMAWRRGWWAGRGRSLGLAVALVVVIALAWLGRGYYLSGYPLYPVSDLGLQAPWEVCPFTLAVDRDNILNWARACGGLPPAPLGQWPWLGSWLRDNLAQVDGFTLPLALGALGWLAASLIPAWRRRVAAAWWWLPAPVVASVGFWFASAPLLRYGGANLWLWALMGLTPWLAAWERPGARRWAALGLCLALLTTNALIQWRPAAFFLLNRPALVNDCDLRRTGDYQNVAAQEGLRVNMPTTPNCWNTPVPCAQEGNPRRLRLVVPGRLESGFIMPCD